MTASRALGTPIAMLAIAVLIVNDHYLKASYPGLVTGKLSDVAGLIFFPLLLAAAAEQLGLRRGMKTIIYAVVATAIVFASIKLSTAAGDIYRLGLALLQWPFRAVWALFAGHATPGVGRVRLVADATDLFALGALAIPIVLARRVASGYTPKDVRPGGVCSET